MDAALAPTHSRFRISPRSAFDRPAAADLLRTTPGQLVRPGSRVVVVAPHPDDEVLALGATFATLARLGHEILVVAVTDGEGSHPGSAHWAPETLRAVRPLESRDALECLGMKADVLRLGLPDGAVADHEKKLAESLPLGSHDTVFVPWRHDGHADHEACARASLAACRIVGARCIEFPVWSLVPSHAAHTRLRHRQLQGVTVSSALAATKRRAIEAFASQVLPDEGTPPVLQQDALGTWQGDVEWVLA